MKIAGLDSSGQDYALIGAIIGEEKALKRLHSAIRGKKKYIHMRKYCKSTKKRIANMFLENTAKTKESIHTLSIKTGLANAMFKARARAP